MPGSGKTALGQVLAEKVGMSFLDADSVLEAREGRSIKDFFAEGEECFRDAEERTAQYLSTKDNCVIAAGGGAVKRAATMEALRASGKVIFIDRPPEAIVADVDVQSRPLLAIGKERVFDLYNDRIELYHQYADYAVPNTEGPKEVLAALIKTVEEVRA